MPVLSILCFTLMLAACGGGAQTANGMAAGSMSTAAVPVNEGSGTSTPSSPSSPAPTSTTPPVSAPVPVGATITAIRVVNNAAADSANTPLTFGQIFAAGAVAPRDTLVGKLDDGTLVPLQFNVKATHADGSVRHAVISTVLPKIGAGKASSLALMKGEASSAMPANVSPASLLDAGFTGSVVINVDGDSYAASADSLLRSGAYTTWLVGPTAGEWLVSAPLKNAKGESHPHLAARFAVRYFPGIGKARVDVTVENDWAYDPSPQNLTYDVQIRVGGKTVYANPALKHYHHARWRKMFWWGDVQEVDVQHDKNYLIASKAVPNYDPNLVIPPSALDDLAAQWNKSNTAPMGAGVVTEHMPTTGGRGDIGPLPQWTAIYVLSMDARARKVMLGVGDLGGSWPIHYRDKNTDRVVSLNDYPYMTLLGRYGDTYNPKTGKYEWFPDCTADCSVPLTPDSSHQPSIAFLPYLVTGDYYYLEELHFWANWNLMQENPEYRSYANGLVKADQVRGQAWSLRTLGQAAYITPDDDPMKKYFVTLINNNIDWYNATYSNGKGNNLGVIDGSGEFAGRPVYETTPSGELTGISSWMDDFVTWSIGYLTELGFTNAKPFLAFKAKYPVLRMTDPGYCWIDAAPYVLAIRASATSPVYSTIGEAYRATMRNADGSAMVNSTGARYLDQPCGSQAQADWRTQDDIDHGRNNDPWLAGQMTGYATSPQGFPSNLQPALAVAATSGVPNAEAAWDIFIKRPVKPDYSVAPQWAIVPRK